VQGRCCAEPGIRRDRKRDAAADDDDDDDNDGTGDGYEGAARPPSRNPSG